MKEQVLEIPYKSIRTEALTAKDAELYKLAQQAALKAYAPYSKFSVGAAVLLDNGKMVSGSNQENAAYPSGTCAERTCLFYANATYPEAKVLSLAVVAMKNGSLTEAISPCGACRQVMAEVSARYRHPFRVLLIGKEESIVLEKNTLLLPLKFDGESLQ